MRRRFNVYKLKTRDRNRNGLASKVSGLLGFHATNKLSQITLHRVTTRLKAYSNATMQDKLYDTEGK